MGRKSRASSRKRKWVESTDQSELSALMIYKNKCIRKCLKHFNKVESAVNFILKHEALCHLIAKAIKSELEYEPAPLQNQIDHLKKTRRPRTILAKNQSQISGIKEQDLEENTDDLVLDVTNNLILKHQGVSLNNSQMGRTYRVEPPPTTSTKNLPRDIIIRFISSRDRYSFQE